MTSECFVKRLVSLCCFSVTLHKARMLLCLSLYEAVSKNVIQSIYFHSNIPAVAEKFKLLKTYTSVIHLIECNYCTISEVWNHEGKLHKNNVYVQYSEIPMWAMKWLLHTKVQITALCGFKNNQITLRIGVPERHRNHWHCMHTGRH